MSSRRPCASALCALVLAAVALLLFAAGASAATHTYRVRSSKDAVHGSCSASKCTLRDAVIAADKAGGKSTIIVPAGSYKLTLEATSAGDPTDNPQVGDLDIDNGAHVTIKGAGASRTILNANFIDRLFAVHQGASLTLSGVTVEHGDQSGLGAGANSIAPADGGAIYNDGTLEITKAILEDNSSYDNGGVIFTDIGATSTSVSDSSVTMNSADDPGAFLYALHGAITLKGDNIDDNFADAEGGAIFGDAVGEVTVSHTKLEYNAASGFGGAIALDLPGKVSISDSTLTHNSASAPGGAIYVYKAKSVSIAHSTLSQNAAHSFGGALYLDETGPASVIDAKFSENSAGNNEDGGAILAHESERLTVSGTSFDANSADAGGAIDTVTSNLTVKRSHFTDNTASDGGALYVEGTLTSALQSVTSSVFTGNLATDGNGGAVDDEYGDLSLTDSTLYRDQAANDGGGLFYASEDAMALVNDTIDGNGAAVGAGLAITEQAGVGQIVLRNDTIARNTAYEGGGIVDPSNANTIVNTIVADNVGELGRGAPTGSGDCEFAFDFNIAMSNYTATADAGHNLDSDHSCIAHPGGSPAAGDKTANPKLGPLKNNGGPVPTDALLKGSPAIGAADKAQCPKTDARGVKRSGKCDIGAYQVTAKKGRRK